MAHTFDPSIWETKAGRSLSSRQLSLYREFLDSQSYKVRPCLKVKVVRYGTVRMYVRMYDVCT